MLYIALSTTMATGAKAQILEIGKTDGTEIIYTEDDTEILLEDADTKYVRVLPQEEPDATFDVNVTYRRTFNTTNFQSCVLPFDITKASLPVGMHVCKLAQARFDVNGEELVGVGYTLIESSKKPDGQLVRANVPFLVYVDTPGTYELRGTQLVAPPEEGQLLQTNEIALDMEDISYYIITFANYTQRAMKAEKGMFVSKGSICYTENPALRLQPYRMYMRLYTNESIDLENPNFQIVDPATFFAENGFQVSKFFYFWEMEEDATLTGIDAPNTSILATPAQTATYDLCGRQVASTAKGLHLVNGKKVLTR